MYRVYRDLIYAIFIDKMNKDKDGEDGESIITQLESITNQNQSIFVAEGQPSHVNKGD